MDAKTKHQQILLVSKAIEKFRGIHGPRWVKLSEEELAIHKEWQYILDFRKNEKTRKKLERKKQPRYVWCAYDTESRSFTTGRGLEKVLLQTRLFDHRKQRILKDRFYRCQKNITNLDGVYIARCKIKQKLADIDFDACKFCELVLKKDFRNIEEFIKEMAC